MLILFMFAVRVCVRVQVGAPRGPHGPGVLRGPHHAHHHLAAAHAGVGAQLRGVAAPAQPAAGRHAAVQPAVHLRGEEEEMEEGGRGVGAETRRPKPWDYARNIAFRAAQLIAY